MLQSAIYESAREVQNGRGSVMCAASATCSLKCDLCIDALVNLVILRAQRGDQALRQKWSPFFTFAMCSFFADREILWTCR